MAKTNGNGKAPPARATIASVEVESFRRLKVARVDVIPGTGVVRVTGLTAEGKTSLLRAISGSLGGDREVHEESLQEGAEAGRTTVRLTNGFTIERRFTEAAPKGYLTITSGDGGKYGQEKLNTWLGAKSFDPMAFLSLSADRQRDVLFSIGTDPDLGTKLAACRKEHAKVYADRTPVISRRRELAKLKAPEGTRPEAVDVSAELARLGALQLSDRERGDAFRALIDRKKELGAADEAVQKADLRVLEIEQSLRAAQRDASAALEVAGKAAAAVVAAREAAEAIQNPAAEIEAVQARLQEADAVTKSLAPWVRFEDAEKELAELATKEEQLDAELGSIEEREASLLANAGIPVPGLSFGASGEPLLNTRPTALASGREKVDFAVDVAFAADPEIGVCLIDEGDALDLASIERLNERAVEKGFQVWICRLGLEGPGEIVVVDGVARGRDDPQETAEEPAGVPALRLER